MTAGGLVPAGGVRTGARVLLPATAVHTGLRRRTMRACRADTATHIPHATHLTLNSRAEKPSR
ncbi:MAG: hypothetical protein RL490_488 [Pseudomonadota bacterium]|jgi:hypothetical protein